MALFGKEKTQLRNVKTTGGTAVAYVAPNARATFVPLNSQAAGQAAKQPSNVAAIVARNARITRLV